MSKAAGRDRLRMMLQDVQRDLRAGVDAALPRIDALLYDLASLAAELGFSEPPIQRTTYERDGIGSISPGSGPVCPWPLFWLAFRQHHRQVKRAHGYRVNNPYGAPPTDIVVSHEEQAAPYRPELSWSPPPRAKAMGELADALRSWLQALDRIDVTEDPEEPVAGARVAAKGPDAARLPLDRVLAALNLESHADPEKCQPPGLALLAGRACRRAVPRDLPAPFTRFRAALERVPPPALRFSVDEYRPAWRTAGHVCLEHVRDDEMEHGPRCAASVAGIALIYLAASIGPKRMDSVCSVLDAVASAELPDGLRESARRLATGIRADEERRMQAARSGDTVTSWLMGHDPDILERELEDILDRTTSPSRDERGLLELDVDTGKRILLLQGRELRFDHGKSDRPLTTNNHEGRFLLTLAQGRTPAAAKNEVVSHVRAALKLHGAIELRGKGAENWSLSKIPTLSRQLKALLARR